MFSHPGDFYKVLLPDWVFITAFSDDDVEQNAIKYLKRCYPERELVDVEGNFAICKMRN